MLTNIINGLKRLYAGIVKPAVYLFYVAVAKTLNNFGLIEICVNFYLER